MVYKEKHINRLYKKEEIERAWETVFTGNDGIIVLTDTLLYLGFFDEKATDEKALIKVNLAKWLLKKIGIYADKDIVVFVATLINMMEKNRRKAC